MAMSGAQLQCGQKVLVTVSFTDAGGNPVPAGAAMSWQSDNPSVQVAPVPNTQTAWASAPVGSTPGQAIVTVTLPASGGNPALTSQFFVGVSAGAPAQMVFSFGTPVAI